MIAWVVVAGTIAAFVVLLVIVVVFEEWAVARAYARYAHHQVRAWREVSQELQRRLEDAGALHLADETTIRQLERRLEAAVSHHEDGGEG